MTSTQAPPALSTTTATVVVRDRAPLLPKIAFVLIGGASLLGTALTNRGLGVAPSWLLVRWLALSAGATAIGFLAWRVAYLRAGDEGPDDYLADLCARGRTIGRGLGALAAASVPAALAMHHLDHRPGLRLGLVVAAVLLTGVLVAGVDELARAWMGLVAAGAVTLGWALADAGTGLPALWRVLHLVAFGAWAGGALWNLAVAIPVGVRHPTVAAVTSGGLQLQRFRHVARVVLPTVVVTGALMALPYLAGVDDLVATVAGRFIAAKVALIVALVAIFITCPLFRQCSPVAGACDLDELDDGVADQRVGVAS